MLTADEVKRDLNDICAQTNAHWLCYDDIHTENKQKDVSTYIREMQRLGYSKLMLLYAGNIQLSYCGGLEIKHQEEMYFSGYTMNGYKSNKNRLIVLSGFETDNDKHTVYHECAHLLQFKYNTFDINSRNNYTTYLSEVHANTFASMVLLLKSGSVLEYKKRRLGRFADGVEKIAEGMFYYMSLPIELQLMKEIRKNGRLNTVRDFQKDGRLDFEKILFYTQALVEKYAYSEEEFNQIKNHTPPLKHLLLQSKARALHLLGKAYWKHEFFKYRKKTKKHTQIEKARIKSQFEKVKRLPQNTHRAEIINEICRLDCYQVEMTAEYGIFNSLSALKDNTVSLAVSDSLKDNLNKIEDMAKTFQKMCDIYQKYKDDKLFQSLFKKIETLNGRDEVWALKEKERRKFEALEATKVIKKQNSR